MTFAARIRRIRMKDGADVHVLHTPMPDDLDGTPENWRGKLVSHARVISGQGKEGSPLDGYIVIGLFADGCSSIAFRLPERLPTCIIPGYVSEMLRRGVIVEREAARVFDDKFEWVER